MIGEFGGITFWEGGIAQDEPCSVSLSPKSDCEGPGHGGAWASGRAAGGPEGCAAAACGAEKRVCADISQSGCHLFVNNNKSDPVNWPGSLGRLVPPGTSLGITLHI